MPVGGLKKAPPLEWMEGSLYGRSKTSFAIRAGGIVGILLGWQNRFGNFVGGFVGILIEKDYIRSYFSVMN